MESIQTNALNSKYINSLLRPEENPFMQEMQSFEEIMMMYSCAIREVKTKFEVLNDDFSVRYKRNPIEFIQSRIKKPVSIAKKLANKGCPVTCASILNNLDDVAGIRVICPFIDDIYMVAEKLISQDDITLIEAKDYISHPKPNGYRSLHLVIETPVYLSEKKELVHVEVQIRTIAMNFWATLEHDLKYKTDSVVSADLAQQLKDCAETIASTDQQMQDIYKALHNID